jgi:tRNA (adenine57-N1/adenine58-N1)-methyltransferase catalytic subunit
MPNVQPNDMVLLLSQERKRYLVQVKPGERVHTHRGWIAHEELLGQPLGRTVHTQMGEPFLAVEPSTYDLISMLERDGQIVFPKDAAQILLRLNLFPGRRVIEAGTGSGGLTVALTRAVMPSGCVYSYEVREDMQARARRNLQKLSLIDFVRLQVRDIADGFDESDVDAVMLDVREPWLYLAQVRIALKGGGFLGVFVPTTGQVSEVLSRLPTQGFGDVVVEEIWQRPWKPVAERLRPADRMIAHTGFLMFARALTAEDAATWWAPGDKRLMRRQKAREVMAARALEGESAADQPPAEETDED